jgi:hypothetical protein
VVRWPGDHPLYYDRDGRPVSAETWERLKFDDPDYFRIDADTVGPYWVSTVWLGIDHNSPAVGPPLIFETMVFSEGAAIDEFTLRSSTVEAARAGHRHVVDLVRWELEHSEATDGRTDQT